MGSSFRLIAAVLGLSTTVFCQASSAGNIQAGARKATTCQVCHGPRGRSTNPLYPKLAGQHAKYMVKQLHAFKSGHRPEPVMKEITASLSDADFEDLAAFFEAQK